MKRYGKKDCKLITASKMYIVLRILTFAKKEPVILYINHLYQKKTQCTCSNV